MHVQKCHLFSVLPLQRDLEDVGNLSNFVPELLAKMEEKLEAGGLDEPDCWLVASCEANRPGVKFSFATLGDAVQELYRWDFFFFCLINGDEGCFWCARKLKIWFPTVCHPHSWFWDQQDVWTDGVGNPWVFKDSNIFYCHTHKTIERERKREKERKSSVVWVSTCWLSWSHSQDLRQRLSILTHVRRASLWPDWYSGCQIWLA